MQLLPTDRRKWIGTILATLMAVSGTARAGEIAAQASASVSAASDAVDDLFSLSTSRSPVNVTTTDSCDTACIGACCDTLGSGNCDDWLGAYLGDGPLLSDLRGMYLGDCLTGSVGGEVRYRFMNEENRLRPGGPGRSTYDLWRITPFAEVKYGDSVTAYIQAIDATISNEELPITTIDQNQADLLQYYVDVALGDVGCGKVRARVGRQFLKFGSQHLVSPLGWSNTYRNFEGIKLYYTSDDWRIDGFWTKPVNGAAGNIFRPRSFDHPDASRNFAGIYSTYKGIDNTAVDFYFLLLDEENDDRNLIDGERYTFGARYDARCYTKDLCGNTVGTLAYELEGALQTGDHETLFAARDEGVLAGMVHSNVAYTLNRVCWTPTIKGVFYWGSGDNNPGNGKNNNFNTLFPLGHAYWGIIDNLNGSNLFDYSIQSSVKPMKKLTIVSAIHWFEKEEAASPIFNVAGAPVPAGATSTNALDIGTELDIIATYKHSQALQVQAGYQWFWYGDAVTQAAAPLPRGDASQFYFMTTVSF